MNKLGEFRRLKATVFDQLFRMNSGNIEFSNRQFDKIEKMFKKLEKELEHDEQG